MNINAQESVSIHWPLTSGDAGFLTSPGADVAFAPGRSVSVVTFDQAHGAGSIGWAARERSNDAYYEYRIAPQAGYTFRLVQLNVEISMSRGELKVAAYASTNGYRSPSSPIGLPRLAATTSPRNLSLPADISVSYPDTLSIRIYAWGARDQQVSFYNRHVRLEGLTTVDSTMLANVQPEVTEKREEIPPAMTEPGKTPDSLQLAASAIHVSDSIDTQALQPATEAWLAEGHKPDTLRNNGNLLMGPKGNITYTTSGTWTCPAGVTQVTVECWGGGGGCGTSYTYAGGGAGGGAYASSVLTVVPGNSYSVVVGAGGGISEDGGNSTFGNGPLVKAAGGSSGSNNPGNGGSSTIPFSIGNTRYSGGNGGSRSDPYRAGGGGGGSATSTGNGGNGGNASWNTGGTGGLGQGNGGKGGDRYYSGSQGISPGGGGGGRGSGNNTGSGTGANGQVTITWVDCAVPTKYNVTGGGSYCSGGTGLPVGVDNSESDVTYQLFRGATALTTINGTGNAISFGNQTVAGTYTVVATRATCTTNMNGSASITVLTIPAQPSAITGNTSPCQGTSQTYSVTNVAGNTYTWTFPTGWTQTAGGTSNSVTVTVGSSNGTITVTPSNACGTGSAGTLSVTTSTTPAQPSDITGNTSPCQGTSQTYSVTNVAGVTYTWTFPTGWTQTAGGTSNSVTVTVGTGNGNIMVTPSNACGNGTSRTLAVTTTTTPAQPSAIAGNNLPCQGSTQTYSVTNVNGVTYTWTVPAGWSINSGQGSNSVVVSVGAASGNISVTPSNSCGNGTAQSLAVTIQSLPVQTSPINPVTTQVCQNSVHNFSVMPPPPAGFTYNWAGPAGSTILSGQGTNIIQIRFGNQSGNLSITPHNSCGDGPAQTMAINVSTSTPAIPGAITGVIAPCIGSSKTYNIPDLGYIYTWSVPSGWIIVSGQGSSSINVTVGATAGNISVTAGNACGGSAARTLTVTPQASAPAQPSAITGNSPVCAGSTQTYAVTNVPFVVYTWSTPAGWTLTAGQGTNSVTYTVGATSGTITVTPSNDCGTGIAGSRNIVVDVAPPANTSAIAGLNNPCQNSSQTYSVTNVSGVTYTWAVPADWTINAGQGTNLIAVTVGSVNGNITVVPSNGCGNGATSTLPVTVFLLPATAGTISGDILFCEGTEHTYSVTPVSGITYDWTVPAGWSINSGQGTNSINITAGVNSGNVQVTPQNACGNGPPSLLAVTVNPLPAAETGPDGAICVGDDIQIGAPPVAGNTYLWTPDPLGEVFDFTVSNPVVEPNVNTTYTLVETNTSTGCSNTNSVIILANQIIAVTVVPLEQTMCSGSTTNFVISSNISGTIFTWEPNLDVGNAATTTGYSSGSGPLIHQTITNVSSAASTISYFIKAIADECENTNLSAIVYINPEPVSDNQTPAAICSDIASGVNFAASTNGLSIASYNILSINNNGLSASSGNPQTGNGFSANEIADDAWTNLTTAPVNVVYTVQGVSNSGCAGNQFTVTLVINPEPMVTNPATNEICSGASTNINLTANIPSTFTWTIGTITGGITGAAPGSGNTINQTLINPDNATPGTVDYIVTPTASTGSCAGAPFTITVTVYPAPVVTNAATKRICSGTSTNIDLTSSTPCNFTWTTGVITGSITGASGDTGNNINQVLTNPSNATSGTVEYLVTATSTSGGCTSAPFTITVTVDPIPEVNAWAVPTAVCPGVDFDLFSSSSLTYAPSLLLEEKFNGATNTWTKINNSYGGDNPALAAWTLRPDNYSYGVNFHSNDNSQFYLSNSDAQGSSWGPEVTETYLQSPSINTNGYSTLSLDFYHYYREYSNSSGRVQVSTNGTTWTTIRTYNTTQGAYNNFNHQTIDLSAYTGNNNFYIRFYYYAEYGWYWAIDNVTLSGTSNSAIPIISWSSTPAGFTSNEPSIQNITQGTTTTYTVSYTNPLSLCSANASVTVTNLEPPNATITADYCSVPGKIRLTASGGVSYLWNTGQTGAVIEVDIAGQYSVVVTGANGCTATATLGVSTDLVVNGDFSAGNTGFTSGYVYDPTPNGLYAPESEYAIHYNAQYTHTNFWGYDHTVNNGLSPNNFMIVNGAKYSPQPTVWQETVNVEPNTDYYFSAYAISLNNVSPYAQLRFEVNGVQVGTTAILTAGVNSNANPWLAKDRFYGTWN
ncbi:MAG: hypothetical protein H6550_00030, partial [Chitinophagales bacterium]|nr:hypothetical protein [Chitinophagales bacterium]